MNDERLLGEVGTWLKETDATQPDTEQITERAMAQVPSVRQRGRWWPLPFLDDHREQEPVPGSRSPLFSAMKLVAAGIVLGLFGGFLLAGILTAPPAERSDPAGVTDPPTPMTVDRLRAIGTTVEVEPGVLRVVDDGVQAFGATDGTDLTAGGDGGIWLLSLDGFRRVGSTEGHAWPAGAATAVSDFEVAADGIAWSVLADGDGRLALRSFDGDGSTEHRPDADTHAVAIASDGSTWAISQAQGSETVALGRLTDGEQLPVATWPESELHGGDLYLTKDGEVWIVGGPRHREGKPVLHRLVDGTPVPAYASPVVAADIDPGGDAWLVSADELIRLEATGATDEPKAWTLPEAMTSDWGASRWSFLPEDAFRAAPDGSVWFALRAVSEPPFSDTHCAGIAAFDGTSWHGPFLGDRCVASIELGVDGSVWVLAGAADASDALELFVVTPTVSSR